MLHIVIIYKLSFRVLIDGRNEGVTFSLGYTRFQFTACQNLLFIGRLQEAVRGNLLCHAQSHISKLKCSHTLVGHALSHISNVISNL